MKRLPYFVIQLCLVGSNLHHKVTKVKEVITFIIYFEQFHSLIYFLLHSCLFLFFLYNEYDYKHEIRTVYKYYHSNVLR